MRRLLPILSLALALAAAAPAQARWFPLDRVDAGDVQRPVVDLGLEEGGGLVYVKTDANGSRAWLSRLASRGWTKPAALSGPGTTEAAVAAGERGRLAAAWIQDGIVYGALVGAPATPLSTGGGAQGLAIEMGVNGVAYAVWAQNGDVRAARLSESTWEPVPTAVDVDPARAAGAGALRPKVAVAADGSALVVWGEVFADGSTHVLARRIYGTTLSALPQDATLAGGSADSPEVDIEYDRSYAWVAFRQDAGGASHSFARRLRASTFEAPFALDAGNASAGPAIAMSSSGIGHAVSVAGGLLLGAPLRDDVFSAARRTDRGGAVTNAAVATSERNDTAVAWRAGADASAVVRARLAPDDGRIRGTALLSRATLGPVAPGALSASSNRIGDVAVAFVQGAPGARSVGAAVHDLPPSPPALRNLPEVVGRSVLVRWAAGQHFGGPQRFRVLVDGRVSGTTSARTLRVRLRRGKHRINVVGVDRRGQRSERGRRQTVVARG
jgi:hypothetical protein